jgi:hypothetical protein
MLEMEEARKLMREHPDVRHGGDQPNNFQTIIPKSLLINKAKRFL